MTAIEQRKPQPRTSQGEINRRGRRVVLAFAMLIPAAILLGFFFGLAVLRGHV